MALKKPNLSPEVKSRLRQAVLGEISPKKTKSNPAIMTAAKAEPKIIKPALKTLKKITPNPLLASVDGQIKVTPVIAPVVTRATAKAAAKTVKAHKKLAAKTKKTLTKLAKKKVSVIKAIAPQTTVARPLYKVPNQNLKRDWELQAKPTSSLETLFSTPKSSFTTKPSFFKKPVTAVKPAKLMPKATGEKPPRHWGLVSFLKLLGLVVLALIVLLLFDVYGIYQLGFRDNLSYQVSQTLQLPAGSVNGDSVLLATYLNDIKLLNLALSQKREGLVDYSTDGDIKTKVFYRLAAINIMAKKLAGYGKSVTAVDVNNQVNLLLQQTGGQQQTEKIVKNLYGLTLAQFQEKILGPMVLRESLQLAIISDESLPINQAAKARAEQALKLALVTSTDFASLAKQYSDDESSINTGGDLGWVTKGQLDPQWESLVFKASSSTVLPQLVKSTFGYHVVKVEQRLTDPITKAESVKLRHILVKVDVDKYVNELLASAKLVKFVK